MANSVRFIYIAVDRFTRIANKIGRAVGHIGTAATKATKSFTRFNVMAGKAASSVLKFTAGLAKSALKAAAWATGIGVAVGYVLNKFVNAASDAEETASKFNVVFSDVSKQANEVAVNLAKNYGLSSGKSKQLLSDTGDLLTGFGFTGKSALDLSKKVQELAVDLASFTNFSGGAEGASAALTKALLGERESVKSLGISILEEDVKRQVQILSAQGMRFETERQAKAYATLIIAQRQSKNAIGDYARTADGLANKKRLLSQRIKDLVVNIGQKLIPIWSALANVAIKVVERLTARVGGLGNALGEKFAAKIAQLEPVILRLTDSFMNWVDSIKPSDIDSFVQSLQALADVATIIANAFGSAFGFVKDLGTELGNLGGAISTGNFKDITRGLLGGDVSNFLFGGGEKNVNERGKNITAGGKSQTDVNINMRAPAGAVESVKSKTSGKVSGLNVGLNMAEAL
jgi:hypothetical protein